jgi:hypothetical protein
MKGSYINTLHKAIESDFGERQTWNLQISYIKCDI